ncbi:RnfABCDGE type electron transport complex subunit B [Clostridium sp.]|uniref:RnfABCDGE type electron transport complex subunit B n=1 Tax=Clostridium sp. TaxID=1506 RepID=UPI002FC7E13F
MEMQSLVFPVISLGGLGIIFGLLLGYANDKFKVEVDERIPLVREALPGANCGGCGFAGCDAYAEAVVTGNAKANKCAPGGAVAVEAISNILGVVTETSEPTAAYIKCQGTCSVAKEKYTYQGIMDCNQAVINPGGGSKACEYGCLGLGSCVKVCQFGALEIIDGIARVIEDKCTSCGACVNACPKGLIEITPVNSRVRIQCNSKNKGKDVMDTCSVGCFACGICSKNCPESAITMVNNLPIIDYSKCVNCGICVVKCPKKTIEDLRTPEQITAANLKTQSAQV